MHKQWKEEKKKNPFTDTPGYLQS